MKKTDFLKQFPKPQWAVDQLIRGSGLVEDVCKCGVGHPNLDWMKKYDPDGSKYYGVHGCCGCCTKIRG